MMDARHVVLSGCSGGGKSAVLAELELRGFTVVSEPGRRIVEQERRGQGRALPWVDLAAFAERAVSVAANDRRLANDASGWIFFDRGLVDAAVALQHATGRPAKAVLDQYERYYPRVFLTPPWPEIYITDCERRHDWAEAVAEYGRLLSAYVELRYDTIVLPKVGVGERADFVLQHLQAAGRPSRR